MSSANDSIENKKSTWASVLGCFCLPVASGKKECREPTLDDANMRRLNNEELTRELSNEVDEKAVQSSTIVCEEPESQPRPSSAPKPLQSHPPTPSSTADTEEPAATMLRSRFSTRRAKPRAKTLDRLESAPIVEVAPAVEPMPLPAPPPPAAVAEEEEEKESKKHHRRWSSATNMLDSSKTTIEIYLVEGSQSLPTSPARNEHEDQAASADHLVPFIKHQKNNSSITLGGGSTSRSRAYTVPGESVKKPDTAVIKVGLMAEPLVSEQTAAPTRVPAPAEPEPVAKKTHISNCFRPKLADTVLPPLDSPTLPPALPSTPMVVPEFPLPPQLPAILHPTANQRRSLSFVSQWLFNKTDNSYPAERISIPDSVVVKEIVSLCFSSGQHFKSANASSTTVNTYKTCNVDDAPGILSAWWISNNNNNESNRNSNHLSIGDCEPGERRSFNVAGKMCAPLSPLASMVFTV